MKWSDEHDVMLGREIVLFELWKYKAGSHERGQWLDRIASVLVGGMKGCHINKFVYQ